MNFLEITLVSIVLFAIWIIPNPKTIAILLLADFCFFIGFDILINTNGLEDKIWVHPVTALINFAFMQGFLILGARYLALISALIAVFYVSTSVALYYKMYGYFVIYFPVMLGFCLLQIAGLYEGIADGCRHFYRNHISNRRNTPRYRGEHRVA